MNRAERIAIVILLLLVAFAVAPEPAWGQEVTAAITGIVTDPSGAPIVNAKVIATDTQRGLILPTQTNETGVYFLPRVPVGNYTLKVEAQGFQTSTVPAFTLILNQTAKINIAMKIGLVSEAVEVTGSAPILQTETTQLSTLLDAKTNDSMPLMSRNYVQLTLITPGAVHPNPQNMTESQTMQNAARPYINGNSEQSNNFILDGMDNNQVGDNEIGYTPSIDAIQEFNLIAQNPSAEFGDFQGGIINTSIKSGTDKFHGDVFEFLRNDVFNANRWSNGLTKGGPVGLSTYDNGVLRKPKERWNMFGAAIGGPIIKRKLFFFADYQGQRLDFPPAPTLVPVIKSAYRAGNFSDICQTGFSAAGICNDTVGGLPAHQLYNPITGQPFLGNIIPAEMQSPVARALFASQYYPEPTIGGTQIINNSGNQINNDQGDLRIDYVATSKDTLFGRWSQMRMRNPFTDSWALAMPTGPSVIEPAKNAVVNWDHTFSPNLMNEVRFGFNWVGFSQSFTSTLGNFAEDTLHIANGNVNGPGMPEILLNGSGQQFGNDWIVQAFGSTTIQAQDSLMITHGRHVMSVGFEFKRWRYNAAYAGNSGINGQISFDGRYTEGPAGNANNGYDVADFFLGMPSQVARGGATGWGQRSSIYAGYFQDNWKVTDNLTLNLGLRYENHTPWVEAKNRQVNFGLYSGDIQFAGQNGNSDALYNGYNLGWDFQPRIGFAWAPAKFKGKTVFRGAWSVSTYAAGMGSNNRLPQNIPFVPGEVSIQNTCSMVAGVWTCPASNIANGIPMPVAPSLNVTPASYAGVAIRMWDPNWQPAVSQQYNVSIQHQFTNSTTFQIGYVGNMNDHLTQFTWANQGILVSPGVVQPGPYVAGNPALKSAIGAIRGTFSNGKSRYDALQTVLNQRLANGLQGQASYTFSKCLTNDGGFYGSSWSASQTSVGMASPQNIYDMRGDWGNCYFDATHAFTGYFMYELPFGKGKRFGGNLHPIVNGILGNWEMAGTVSLRSGFHLEVDSWADPSGTGAYATRPNLVGQVSYPKTFVGYGPGNIPGIQWFDPSVLVMPAAGYFGNEGIGAILGPPLHTMDFSLHKSFPLGESKRFEFRVEAMNLTNTPVLLFPAGATFFDGLSGTGGDRTTGKITQSSNSREMQFALKFYF